MKKIYGFSLAEIVVSLVILSFLAVLTIPTFVSGANEKMFATGYKKAYNVVSNAFTSYAGSDEVSISSDEDSIVQFIKYFIENTSVSELYAEGEPTQKSDTYAALKFKGKVVAGAKDPISTSSKISIESKPTFWVVTDDNLSYSAIIPNSAKCSEVLNINTAKNLNSTLKASCFAIIVDTNGLFKNPNKMEETQDIAKEEYLPNLTNDRYYIFVGSDGTTKGNPKHILTGKLFSTK